MSAAPETLYTGDGTTSLYSFNFPYLEPNDVKISIDEVDLATTEYIFANATNLQLNTAPALNAAIRIYRVTDSADIRHVFFPGSSIRARDLNDNFTQSIYIVQESLDSSITAAEKATQAAADAASAQAAATNAQEDADAAVTSASEAQSQVAQAAADAAAAEDEGEWRAPRGF